MSERIILAESQGSAEWLKNRMQTSPLRINASEVPAILGLDPYMSRDEWLKMRALGLTKEFSEWQQRILDRGHAVEEFALDELGGRLGQFFENPGPVGWRPEYGLAASLDGIAWTSGGSPPSAIVEVKLWNKDLVAAIDRGEVPPRVMAQMQAQWIVWADSEEHWLVVTDGTHENFRYIGVNPCPEWRDRILAALIEAKADIENYDYGAPVVIPEPPKSLPVALDLIPPPEVEASVLITRDNARAWAEQVRQALLLIPVNPSTDDDFDFMTRCAKWCDESEKKIDWVIDTGTRNEIFDLLRDVKGEIRGRRLWIEKTKTARREAVRAEQVQDALRRINGHIEEANHILRRIGVTVVSPGVNLVGEMAGKRIAAAKAAAEGVVRDHKTQIDRQVVVIQTNHAVFAELVQEDLMGLFPDRSTLLRLPDPAIFRATILQRIADHKAAQEKARIEAAERAAASAARIEAEAARTRSIPGNAPSRESIDPLPGLFDDHISMTQPQIVKEADSNIIHSTVVTWQRMPSAPHDRRVLLVYRIHHTVLDTETIVTGGQWCSDRKRPYYWHCDLAESWGLGLTRQRIPVAWSEIPSFIAPAAAGEVDMTKEGDR